MQTTNSILVKIREAKSCSRAQLYRYLKRFGIRPFEVRQRPQLYPDETAEIILANLGLKNGNGVTITADAPLLDATKVLERVAQQVADKHDAKITIARRHRGRLVSVKTLKAARADGKKARAAK